MVVLGHGRSNARPLRLASASRLITDSSQSLPTADTSAIDQVHRLKGPKNEVRIGSAPEINQRERTPPRYQVISMGVVPETKPCF